MKSRKGAWLRVSIYIISGICIMGCTNNKSRTFIANSKNNHRCTRHSIVVNRLAQPHDPHAIIKIEKKSHVSYISQKRKRIYNGNYYNIYKGSYSNNTYQVKHGDTLFYIAWRTGQNYRDLAKKNNILKPFYLHIGQTLHVEKNTPLDKHIVACRNHKINILRAPIFTESTQLNNKKNLNYRSDIKKHKKKILTTSHNEKVPIGKMVLKKRAAATSCRKGLINWHWPTRGKIIDNFSPEEGGNKGVDISGFQGQPIVATASGRVVYAGNALQGYGNLIIIKHNNNYLSAYAHNDTLLVRKQPKEVKAGQKIATMGKTGTNTTRLHFEIRYKGKSVNPLYYLPQK
ncbi:murein hydrolase activator NlpD [Candidatus Steffania adelgidicola]|uniref:murein hydrolase activator NlpD n=1 Tax=Candidatus Steffania adelgidicola TaxID=1076626 RepID=UPI001D02E03B|nr:murein hydrolase activator NlpD [Candidatus Steffania adelgidicola]UDG79662.1 hypothetical protein GFK82_00189 [Candidatus Steffania adelgidicola]